MKRIFLILFICVAGCQERSSSQQAINMHKEQSNDSLKSKNNYFSINSLNLTSMQKKEVQLYMDKLHQFYKNSKEEISYYDEYVMSLDEMNLAVDIFYQYLQSVHYKFVSDSVFNERINQIFDADKRKKKGEDEIIEFSNSFYIQDAYYKDYSMLSLKEKSLMNKNGEWQYNFGVIGFAKNHNFIFELTPVTQLFDEKEANLVPVESFFSHVFNRNNYLFNDDKVSLVWLLQNDTDFLDDLVRVFGYDKEPRINRMVLRNAEKLYMEHSDEALRQLFVAKDCNGQLQIREGLLKTIADETDAKHNGLFDMLDLYCYAIASNDSTNRDIKDMQFNFAERCKIVAYICNTTCPLFTKYKPENSTDWSAGTALDAIVSDEPKVIEEIVKNKYYGLPQLKSYIDDAKQQYIQDTAKPDPDE